MLREELKKNAVALLSLVVAVMAITLATYRSEVSEENRTIRQAAFEAVKQLGELQLIVDYAHYDQDAVRGNPITGWGRVALIQDLCLFISSDCEQESKTLLMVWQENWSLLGQETKSVETVTKQIGATKQAVLRQLNRLH